MKFVITEGIFIPKGKTFEEALKVGDVVESESNLAQRFPNKFAFVSGSEFSGQVKPPPIPANDDAPEAEDTKNEESIYGRDKTSEFHCDSDTKVYVNGRGRGVKYTVFSTKTNAVVDVSSTAGGVKEILKRME